MIVIVRAHQKETKSKAWMTRRSREMLRRVLFVLSVSPVLASGDGDPSGVRLQVEVFMDGCICTLDFPEDWSNQQIEVFTNYMKEENNFSVELIPSHQHGTMSA